MTTNLRTISARELTDIADWHKSSYSTGSGNNCVEVADLSTSYASVAVRDSKAPTGPALLIRPASWADFLATVKSL